MEKNKITFLDGAMGTMLQAAGLKMGVAPESMNLTAPDVVIDIHRQYISAGSDIIYTNTFGANRHKLARTEYSASKIIFAGVDCARKAAEGSNAKVALDIGPIGQLIEPYGTMKFEEAYDVFREMIEAGAKAGADLIAIETMTDLYEVKAAVLAAKENCDLPVLVTMSFEASGRTFTGCSPEAMAAVLSGLGVDAMGVNCSLGPVELRPIVERLAACTDAPLIVKANAGLPDPETGTYHITAESFAAEMACFTDFGVHYMGGCCGTSPAFIKALSNAVRNEKVHKIPAKKNSFVCTPTCSVPIDGVRVIGERINPTGKKRFKQALIENDLDYIMAQAVEQSDGGAHILDINVGLPEIDEPEMMVRVVKAVQSVVDLPLQLDSSDPAALEAGLRVVNGKAIVNSVNGEPAVLDRILPLVKKYGAAVVGLTMDQNGIPATAEKRFAIAERILEAARAYGIADEDVFIDCLTLTVSAEQDKAQETLKAMQMVRERLGLHCVLGVSNISFGLPRRELVTSGFLTLAMAHGLDLPIVNPNAPMIMDTIRVFNVIYNRDQNAEKYIEACANASQVTPAAATVAVSKPENGELPPLAMAVVKGMKSEARRLTEQLLADLVPELEIVNCLLIPALDHVGAQFETGALFLPQLINAAGAAQEAFEVLRTAMANNNTQTISKGKVIVATVKGDIHDIGKNIVKTIVENYGYTVIDLGRDVAPETIVETAIREDVHLIGLSALMTTTLGSMEQTISALRASGHECKIWVGGAVLTLDYAEKIGADYYAKDAKESVDICKAYFG